MKNKLLISALLVAAYSVNAGVLIAPGVTLESERTWTTGKGATGYVVNYDSGNAISSAYVTAQTNSTYGTRNSNIMLSGDHSVSLDNTSQTSERFTTLFKICSNGSCTRQQRTFSIARGHRYTNTATTYLNTSYSQVGSYDIDATTEVTGDANANDSARGTAVISR
jgi:hypothetical protein